MKTATRLCLVLAALALSGCVVAPYPGYYGHRGYWYGGYHHGYHHDWR